MVSDRQDLNVGILFILGISALGIFGIVLGGWASNSHYSLLGALRSAAQLVSYETAAGMAIVGALLLAGTLSTLDRRGAAALRRLVYFRWRRWHSSFTWSPPSRKPIARRSILPEAESELVAGYMTEYSGFRWALYFLAEYTNMIVVASIATTLFLGGWLRPFPHVRWFNFLDFLPALLMLRSARIVFTARRSSRCACRRCSCGLWPRFVSSCPDSCRTSFRPDRCKPAKPGLTGAFWFLLKVSATFMCSCGCGLRSRATALTS